METFEHEGEEFTLEAETESNSPPWEEHDGHGVIYTGRHDKKSHERVLHRTWQETWYYDVAASAKLARDSWGVKPEDVNKVLEQDFKFCQDYLTGNISWWCIHVTHKASGADKYLGGILSDGSDLDSYAVELASEITSELADKDAEMELCYAGM